MYSLLIYHKEFLFLNSDVHHIFLSLLLLENICLFSSSSKLIKFDIQWESLRNLNFHHFAFHRRMESNVNSCFSNFFLKLWSGRFLSWSMFKRESVQHLQQRYVFTSLVRWLWYSILWIYKVMNIVCMLITGLKFIIIIIMQVGNQR